MKKVMLITDGACLDNPGPGGWAALLRYREHEKMLSGSEKLTTNNRMELMAVIRGLAYLKESCDVELVVDSRYVMDAFEKNWLKNWHANGWKTAANKEVKNQDLWLELEEQTRRHRLKWTWVKGHAGHPENERVDEAARQAALLAKQGLWTETLSKSSL